MQLVALISDIYTCAVQGQIHYQSKWAEHGNSEISPIGKGNGGEVVNKENGVGQRII